MAVRRTHGSLLFLALGPMVVSALAACGTDDDHGAEATAGFEEAYAQAELGKADSNGCSGVVVPDKSGFAKRVALTFDDGPNPATTPKVLDLLAAHGVKATFFINGSRVRGDAERALLARIVAEGHILANHSQNHMNLKTVSSTKLASEVNGTHSILVAAGVTPRFFRFPFGSASCSGMKFVQDLGYRVTGWHIDSADWCFASSGNGTCPARTFRYVPDKYRADLEGYVMSQVRAKDGGILLFHDIHANTVSVLPGILEALEDEGFAFVNIDSGVYFPRLNGVTPPAGRFVGDACATDVECNFASKSASAICHRFAPSDAELETGFCTLACQGTCPDKAGASPTFCTSLDDGATGRCVAKSADVNHQCADIVGTSLQTADRFIGESSAAPASADVCIPE